MGLSFTTWLFDVFSYVSFECCGRVPFPNVASYAFFIVALFSQSAFLRFIRLFISSYFPPVWHESKYVTPRQLLFFPRRFLFGSFCSLLLPNDLSLEDFPNGIRTNCFLFTLPLFPPFESVAVGGEENSSPRRSLANFFGDVGQLTPYTGRFYPPLPSRWISSLWWGWSTAVSYFCLRITFFFLAWLCGNRSLRSAPWSPPLDPTPPLIPVLPTLFSR